MDFLEPAPVVRDVVVTGFVFDDANGNGKRDPGEAVIKEVPITNGETILDSGEDGGFRFEFRADEYRLVYVTLPNGYKPTSPWYRLIKQDDTAVSYRFDFGLQKDPASLNADFAFLVAADSQLSSAGEGALLKADMAQISLTTGKPRFCAIAGDLTMTGWLQEWKYYDDAVSALTLPLYNVFGGHEGNYLAETEHKRGSTHHFNLFCGPTYYSWNCGGRHFLVYNSLEDTHLSASERERQRAWLKADLNRLKPGTEVITFSHYPFTLADHRKDLKQVVSFYGHYHENNAYTHDGVTYLCTNAIRGRDWGAMTRTVRFCQFKDGRLITELRPTGQYRRVEVVHPQPGGEVPSGSLPLRVMAFDTASRVTRVTAEIGGRTMALDRLGQFTWGTDLHTDQLTPGLHSLRVSVVDDRPESWPVKAAAFTVAARMPATGAAGDDWPMLFKSLRDLRSTTEEVRPPLDLLWTAPTGGTNVSAVTPIVCQGRVYVGVENANCGQDTHAMLCFDAASGKRLWRAPVDSCVRFSAAVAGGRVYFQTNSGSSYALDALTGQIAWRGRVGDATNSHHSAKGAVITYRDKVLMHDEYAGVVVLNAADGALVRKLGRPGGNLYYGGPFPDGDRLWIPTRDQSAAVDINTGQVLWGIKTRHLATRGVAHGIVHEGVYYQNGNGRTAAIDPADGKVLWQADFANGSWGVPVPTISDGALYTGGRRMAALDLKSGKELWSYGEADTPDEHNQRQTFAGQSSPLVSGGVVYVGREDGYLAALDRKTGERLWRFRTALPIKSSPVVTGNMLFVCDFDGNLYAFVNSRQ